MKIHHPKVRTIFREEVGKNISDPSLLNNYRSFVIQGFLAAVTTIIVFFAIDIFYNAIVGAALAATAFGMFLNPSGRLSRIRAFVGGHTLAIVLGLALTVLTRSLDVETFDASSVRTIFTVVLVLGLGCFVLFVLMACIDCEHPPAAGMLVGLYGIGIDIVLISALLVSLIALVCIKLLIRGRLQNLV